MSRVASMIKGVKVLEEVKQDPYYKIDIWDPSTVSCSLSLDKVVSNADVPYFIDLNHVCKFERRTGSVLFGLRKSSYVQ